MFLSPSNSVKIKICNEEIEIKPFNLFISVLMVVTGSINTLAVKGADMVEAENSAGEKVEFNHPFFQASVMMIGETLCMFVYVLYWMFGGTNTDDNKGDSENTDNNTSEENKDKPNVFLFLPPAFCDVTATSMMYIGLTMTSAAQFQMLRGSIMIFVGLLSVVILKKRLEWFRWAGMGVIVIGIIMVGAADFLVTNDSLGTIGGLPKPVVGDIIIVCAQLVAACQFVYEEKYITKYNVHPLKVVGSEGIFGFTALVLLQIPLYFITFENFQLGYNPDHRLEDPFDAFTQMNNEPIIYGFMCLIIFSIAFFNFAGVSITKYMSATTRKVLDTLRTLIIWACTLIFSQISSKWIFPTTTQLILQAFGFVILVTGIFLYSDVLIMPAIRKRRNTNSTKSN